MRKNKILLFVVITFLITWSIEIPAALSSQGKSNIIVPHGLQTFATLAPGIVAILMSLIFGGFKGLKELLAKAIRLKRSVKWYLFALLTGLVVAGLSLLIFIFLTKETIQLDAAYNLFFYLLLFLFFSPLWEELGWRGYLLPGLQQRTSPLKSALLIGFIWGLWHLPIYLAINPYGSRTLEFFMYAFIGCFPMSIILIWMYNATKESLFFCMLFHDSVNVGATYFYGNLEKMEMRPFIISLVLLIAIAGSIVYKTKGRLGAVRFEHLPPKV